MKRGKLLVLLGSICLIVAMVACAAPAPPAPPEEGVPPPPPPAAPEVFNWKMTHLYPRGGWMDKYESDFCARVATMSNGRLNIEVLWAGEGVDAPEIAGAVSEGLLEMGFPWIGLHTGEIPIGNVEMGVPGTPLKPLEIEAMYYERGYIEKLREAYKRNNLYWLAPCWDVGVYLISKEPITSLDDIAKWKWRSGGSYAVMMESLGASTVTMAFGEAYTSLATGIIDGVAMGTLVDSRDGGWYEIAPYLFPHPMVSFQSTPTIVNLDAWNSLPNDLKAILEIAGWLKGAESYAGCTIKEGAAVEEMLAGGAQWGPTLSAADQAEWIEAGKASWAEIAAIHPDCAELLAILEAFMKEQGYID